MSGFVKEQVDGKTTVLWRFSTMTRWGVARLRAVEDAVDGGLTAKGEASPRMAAAYATLALRRAGTRVLTSDAIADLEEVRWALHAAEAPAVLQVAVTDLTNAVREWQVSLEEDAAFKRFMRGQKQRQTIVHEL